MDLAGLAQVPSMLFIALFMGTAVVATRELIVKLFSRIR